MRRLVVHARGTVDETQVLPEVVVWKSLHSDKDPARPFLRLPTVHERCKSTPASQVEVTDAEVCSRRENQCFLQRGQETGVRRKVVEDTRHRCSTC